MKHCTSCDRDPLKLLGGAVGGSGCGGEGRGQSERQSTVRGRCGPVVGVKIGGRSVEISTEGVGKHSCEWMVCLGL